MRRCGRVAALVAAFGLAGAACSSAATSPSTSPPAPTPIVTPSPPIKAPSPTATPTAGPTATPSPGPVQSLYLPSLHPFPVYIHGQYLLYMTSISPTAESSQPQAWLVKPDGTGARKIADGIEVGPLSPPYLNLDAVWSHDGSTIHIIRYPGCIAHISDLFVSSSTPVAKVTMTDRDMIFRWSPTGGKIAYWHFSGADQNCEQNSIDNIHDLMFMGSDGGFKTTVKANVTYQLTDWLPDGSKLIAFSDAFFWYKVSLVDGSAAPLGVNADRLDVSPDGTKIAYMVGGKLYVRAIGGLTIKNLGSATDFAWRPDSAALAVSSGQLKVVNATSGVGTVIFNFATKKPTWSPDGARLAFIKSSGGGIFVIPAAGGALTPIPGTSKATQVSWEP